jgi:putative endonuclease
MNSNIAKGKNGEEIVRDYLINKGYIIIESNYRNKIGEIDIIAKDKDVLVFIEVKTRTNTTYGYAFEAVDIRKQRKIINTSMVYIKYKKYRNTQLRYDIIEVYLHKEIKINHLENAFCL